MGKQKNKDKISLKKQIEIDILCKSLIGKEITIVESSNKNQIGISGILIYETNKLFYVEISNRTSNVKKILKNDVVLKFNYNGKVVRVNGSLLMNDLIYRLKKLR